jgi:hypothetical protein
MSAHTDPQIITQNGKPAFAVIPWNEYQALVLNHAGTDEEDIWFPNEVVKANVRGDSLIQSMERRSWWLMMKSGKGRLHAEY